MLTICALLLLSFFAGYNINKPDCTTEINQTVDRRYSTYECTFESGHAMLVPEPNLVYAINQSMNRNLDMTCIDIQQTDNWFMIAASDGGEK